MFNKDIAFFSYVMDIEERRDNINKFIKSIAEEYLNGATDNEVRKFMLASKLAPFSLDEEDHIRHELAIRYGVKAWY